MTNKSIRIFVRLIDAWDISAKELVPILITAVVWGHEWKGKQVVAPVQ